VDRLEAMQLFVRVVETGSFTAVAREAGQGQPSISKRIGQLEEHLGVRLLNRTTRTLSLTDDGQSYYEHCRRILGDIDEAEARVGRRRIAPSGLVRLGTPVVFGRLHVVPRLKRFLELYPQVAVELIMGDRFSDLVEEAIDLSVRIGNLADTSLVGRLIGTTSRLTVATPGYFARHGTPRHPSDLAEHNCIVYTQLGTVDEWHFQGPEGAIRVKVKGNFRGNNSEAIREAVLEGIGIAVVPTWILRDELEQGRLQCVLKDYEPRQLPIRIVYPSRHHLPAKVRVLADFLTQEFQADPVISPPLREAAVQADLLKS